MRLLEHLGHFLHLPLRLLRSEVDRRADADRAHVERLPDAREPDLIEGVRVGEELVVVQLQQERDLVRVLRRATVPSTPSVDATALQPPSIASFTMFSGSKLRRVGRERRARRVLDALIDRKDRHVAGTREPAVVDERLQTRQHAYRAIRRREQMRST